MSSTQQDVSLEITEEEKKLGDRFRKSFTEALTSIFLQKTLSPEVVTRGKNVEKDVKILALKSTQTSLKQDAKKILDDVLDKNKLVSSTIEALIEAKNSDAKGSDEFENFRKGTDIGTGKKILCGILYVFLYFPGHFLRKFFEKEEINKYLNEHPEFKDKIDKALDGYCKTTKEKNDKIVNELPSVGLDDVKRKIAEIKNNVSINLNNIGRSNDNLPPQ